MIEFVYAMYLRKATETRAFVIRNVNCGWEVFEEQDNTVVRRVRYDDWHRVERARAAFAVKAIALRETGWVES
jgi:hypothetical protein